MAARGSQSGTSEVATDTSNPSEQQMVAPPVNEKTGKPAETVWDNVAPPASERHSIAEDPDGKKNAKLATRAKK